MLIHLGKPRVVLKRIPPIKTAPKEPTNNYWQENYNTERRGNLKITLKKNRSTGESLKLKFKRSPISEDFTVVSNNFDLDQESYRYQDELADIQENDTKSDSEEEKTPEESFENVMLNQEVFL